MTPNTPNTPNQTPPYHFDTEVETSYLIPKSYFLSLLQSQSQSQSHTPFKLLSISQIDQIWLTNEVPPSLPNPVPYRLRIRREKPLTQDTRNLTNNIYTQAVKYQITRTKVYEFESSITQEEYTYLHNQALNKWGKTKTSKLRYYLYLTDTSYSNYQTTVDLYPDQDFVAIEFELQRKPVEGTKSEAVISPTQFVAPKWIAEHLYKAPKKTTGEK